MFILKLLFKLTGLRGTGVNTVMAMTELVADSRIKELHDPIMPRNE